VPVECLIHCCSLKFNYRGNLELDTESLVYLTPTNLSSNGGDGVVVLY
jgi:hypothetical protein